MSQKLVVTHHHPDLDALTSIWLIKRFLPDWKNADIRFVPAGETFRMIPPDSDPDILHVDTGLGLLDHHQKKGFSSSTKKTLAKIFKERALKKLDKEAAKRISAFVTEIDNGRDVAWPEATSDRYEFMLPNILLHSSEEKEIWKSSFLFLERVFQILRQKVQAEKIIKKKGIVFETRFGNALAVLSGNDQVIYVAQKQGFSIIAKKDPARGHLRIYSRFDRKVDLRRAFAEFKKKDPEASWYLHQSRCLLLNSSRTNPNMKPTKLSLQEIIEILKKA